MLAHGLSDDHLVVSANAVFVAEVEVDGGEIHEAGTAASCADLKHVDLAVFNDVVGVECAVFALHGLESLFSLVVNILDDLVREIIWSVVSVRNSGVALHDVVAVREYELELAVLDERLGSELLTLNELLNNEVVGAGVGENDLARLVEFIRAVHLYDAAASG